MGLPHGERNDQIQTSVGCIGGCSHAHIPLWLTRVISQRTRITSNSEMSSFILAKLGPSPQRGTSFPAMRLYLQRRIEILIRPTTAAIYLQKSLNTDLVTARALPPRATQPALHTNQGFADERVHGRTQCIFFRCRERTYLCMRQYCRAIVCVGVLPCPQRRWSPGTVPYGADQTVYLVVDRFSNGSVYRETEIERTDMETIIEDFLTGQFNDPVRVVAFNTLEHWANDVSKDIASDDPNSLRHRWRPGA